MSPIRLTHRCVTMLMACLLTIGTWQVGEGSWIYAKARLAQWLLQRAWSRSLAGEVAAKPWPWADTWPIARLVVPSQEIDQIVLEGAYGRTLAFGPGHVESTRRLVDAGSIILTGHRDTHFRFLEKLESGDVLALQSRSGKWMRFTVRDRQVVDSRTAAIPTHEDETQLILVTCYPFDAIVPGGPLRYVVTAAMEEDKKSTGGIYPTPSIR
jgi:sortase A